MEIPKVVGRILEVCILNKASVFQRVAAGEMLFDTMSCISFSL